MDGTKRKAPPYSDSVDLGVATPKWTATINYPVSAVSYTQNPYAPPPKRRDSLQMRKEAARAISPFTNDDGVSDGEVEVREYEVYPDNDGVYLINTGESTWSGTLDSEDDPAVQASLPIQVEIVLQRLKHAQSLAAIEAKKLENDHILRGLMRSIGQRLQEGAILTLERLTDDRSVTINCAHPFCTLSDHHIAAGGYYFVLGQPRQLQDAEHYCLFCLEEMWDDKGMVAPLPPPSVSGSTGTTNTATVTLHSDLDGLALDGTNDGHQAMKRYLSGDCEACRTSVIDKLSSEEQPTFIPAEPALDTIPACFLDSRWAPKPGDGARPRTPEGQKRSGMPQSPETPGGPYSPVVREKTRFQHLAMYLYAGESLGEREKEAVKKWKVDESFIGKELSVALGELRD